MKAAVLVPGSAETEIRRFLTFVNAAIACILVFACAYFASAFWLRRWDLFWVGVVLIGWLAAGLLARTLGARGSLAGGATVVGYAALAGAAIVAFIFTFTRSPLLLICVIAIAVALPYLSGKPLYRLMVASFAVAVEVVVVTSFVEESAPLPGTLTHFLVIASVIAATGLMLQLLWQFSSRLRQTLKETRKSEERFRSLVEATTQVVWTAEPSGLHHGDSPSWEAFTGQKPEESKGWGWLDAVHPEDREKMKNAVVSAVQDRRSYAIEHRLRRSNGTYCWTSARGAPVLNEDGTVREWIAVNIDISARKNAEELQQQLIGMVGHDLRGPLSSIITSAELLRRGANSDPKRAGTAARIELSAQRMARIIQDLEDYTRVRFGIGISVLRIPYDLNEICEQVIAEAQTLHPGRKIEYLHSGDPSVLLDPQRIEQMLLNLCINALKYSPDDTAVRLQWQHPGDSQPLRVEVHNGGPAIPSDLIPQLFEPFRRGPQSDKTIKESLGLGLFIVREIVRAHGGTVQARSTSNEGTTLTVLLPGSHPPK